MSNAPTLKTKKLILENHTEKFLSEDYVSWLNNPEVVKYSEQRHKRHTLETCRKYIQSFVGTPNYLWAISTKDSKTHIGNICAIVDENNSLAEIRILIGSQKFQGQGLGYEAWNAVLEFLLKKKKIRKVFAGTLSVNKGMLKVMKKTGMRKEAVLKKHYIVDKKPVDIVYVGKFR